jgi:hypothetical protein
VVNLRKKTILAQQLTLNPNSATAPNCSKEHDPKESVDCDAREAHQTAGARTEFQNELTPELTPRLE